MLKYGYISNGFQDHSLEQMVQVLKRCGYQAVGLTLDHMHLDPFRLTRADLREVKSLLARARLEVVVETGARYYLDAFRKHRPSLVSIDPRGRKQRLAYYQRALDLAAELEAHVVSLWSGVVQPGVDSERAWGWLVGGLEELVDSAERRGLLIGFEPEPGMLVEDLAGFAELKRRIPHPSLKLTLDIGHLAITEAEPLEAHIRTWADEIVNMHIEDIKDRVHLHRPFGEGDLNFRPILQVIQEIGYSRPVLVELSRNSADAPVQAQRSILYLRSHERKAD